MLQRLTLFLLSFFGTTVMAQNTSTVPGESKPFVIGSTHEIYSAELKEKRILNIYLPHGYNKKDTTRYAVIYLLDGSADEDFIHVAGLVQFYNFEWVSNMPKTILVGIANVDRKRDFTFPTTIADDLKKYPTSGNSDRFIAFIEKELQPFISSNFPTSSDKTIIGQSLGGLLAIQILLNKPSLFNKYIIVSPSLWWNNGSLLQQQPAFDAQHLTRLTQVSVLVGKEGATPTLIPRIMEDDAKLLFEKIEKNQNQFLRSAFELLAGEDHASILHQAIANTFRRWYSIPSTE